MFLREHDFDETEGSAPLLKENKGYLKEFASAAWQESRPWAKLILNESLNTNNDGKENDEKENMFFKYESSKQINGIHNNYGLRTIEKAERIFEKDAIRTFLTDSKRKVLISLLTMIKTQLGDYQQTISYVSGMLLLFYDVETVFKMCYILGRSPFYAMNGYWRSEAIDQAIDGFVFWKLLKMRNLKLHQFLSNGECPVMPETFVQKWFGGLGVQCIPTRFLLPFWTKYFKFGFRYLFKFYLNLIDCLSISLINCGKFTNPSVIYEILRLEKKQKFWKSCVDEYKNGKIIKLTKKCKIDSPLKKGGKEKEKGKMKNETFHFNMFVNDENGNQESNNNNGKNDENNFVFKEIVIDLSKLVKGNFNDLKDKESDEFGMAVFFTKVFALCDAKDDRNELIDTIDFTKEREEAWKSYLETRLTNAALNNTFVAMKIGQADDDDDEKECDFCDDGFGEFYCEQCDKYLCEQCQDNPTGDHTETHDVKEVDPVDVD